MTERYICNVCKKVYQPAEDGSAPFGLILAVVGKLQVELPPSDPAEPQSPESEPDYTLRAYVCREVNCQQVVRMAR